jgi:hypothetical protein
VLLIALLLLATLPARASADDLTLCSGVNVLGAQITTGLINPNNIIFTNHAGSAQSILTLSLLIIIMMMLISGLVYAIGYAFRIDKALRFARTEIGEAFVTILIVMLFIGTFSVGSLVIGTPNLFAVGNGSLNKNVFDQDCSMLTEVSFSFIPPMLVYGYQDLVINSLGTTIITLMPDNFGVSFQPFVGMTLIRPTMSLLIYLVSLFIVVPMGTAMFIAFIYALFPLFLYLGIVFRTFPLTRAVGGTFLGLFIAFYVVFPLLLFIMLHSYTPAVAACSNPAIPCSAPNIPVLSNIVNFVSSLSPTAWIEAISTAFTTTELGLINAFIITFAEPVIYVIFSIFLALIISFDFMEALGDLLGAPSLRSSDMLKRVL